MQVHNSCIVSFQHYHISTEFPLNHLELALVLIQCCPDCVVCGPDKMKVALEEQHVRWKMHNGFIYVGLVS